MNLNKLSYILKSNKVNILIGILIFLLGCYISQVSYYVLSTDTLTTPPFHIQLTVQLIHQLLNLLLSEIKFKLWELLVWLILGVSTALALKYLVTNKNSKKSTTIDKSIIKVPTIKLFEHNGIYFKLLTISRISAQTRTNSNAENSPYCPIHITPLHVENFIYSCRFKNCSHKSHKVNQVQTALGHVNDMEFNVITYLAKDIPYSGSEPN